MLKGLRIILFLSLTVPLFFSLAFPQDVGDKDTCRVEEKAPVPPNSHFKVEITAFNDEALGAFAIPLNYGVSPMDIICDSFSFTGTRTIAPGLYGLNVDTANYSLVLYAIWFSGNLPVGDGPIANLYFSTGPNWDSTQGYAVDTVFWPPSTSLEFTNAETGQGFTPAFRRGSIGPYIIVISPNGGEVWGGGETREIRWESSLSDTEYVKIEYSTNGGTDWLSITDSTSDDGSYFWTVSSVYSTNCLVKISEVSDGAPWDASYSNFTILLFSMYAYPSLRVTEVGGDTTDYIVKVTSTGYSSPVTLSLLDLPTEASYSFSLNPVIPSDSSILTVYTTLNTPVGTHLMNLRAQGDGQTVDSQLTLVVNQAPDSFNLYSPENLDTVEAYRVRLSWKEANDPDPEDYITYTVYYSQDSNFTSYDSAKVTSLYTFISPTVDSIFYFWKVKAVDKWGKFRWCNQPFWSFFWIWVQQSGDVNGDNEINVSDVIYLINYLFKGGPPPIVMQSGDVNCDGQVSITDVIYLINYLFKGGPPPC